MPGPKVGGGVARVWQDMTERENIGNIICFEHAEFARRPARSAFEFICFINNRCFVVSYINVCVCVSHSFVSHCLRHKYIGLSDI